MQAHRIDGSVAQVHKYSLPKSMRICAKGVGIMAKGQYRGGTRLQEEDSQGAPKRPLGE